MPHVELPQAEFKVVMLGDTNAGKTSLVLRFAEGYYRDGARSSTVGAFFITKRIQTSGGITCKIQIWDTAGQKQFRAMAPMYYRNAAAAIVCYDVTSQKSYKIMKEWLDELHRNVPAGSIVIAIAGTKTDLTYTALSDTLVPTIDAEQLAASLGAIFVDTSAKTNSNVNDLFQRVAERVLQFRENARREGTDANGSGAGYGGIPVTPGASIENGKVVKKGIKGGGTVIGGGIAAGGVGVDSDSLINGVGNGGGGESDYDRQRKVRGSLHSNGDVRQTGRQRSGDGGEERPGTPNSAVGDLDTQSKKGPLGMCETAPMMCGMMSSSPSSKSLSKGKDDDGGSGCFIS